jgi:outer membrane protein OmpA-like peptidoglycan-associated protein
MRVDFRLFHRPAGGRGRRGAALLAGALAATILAGAAPAAADCNARLADLQALAARGEIPKLEQGLKALKESYECSAAEEVRADALLADRLLADARKIAPGNREAAFALMQQAERLKASWAAAAALADAWSDRKNYVEAARVYLEALRLAADPDAATRPPSREVLAQLRRRSDETRHLAAADAGILVRGLVVRGVGDRGIMGGRLPVPVLFVYNKDVFTPVGEQAARELAEFVKTQNFKSVTLFGHTDPIGSDAFNMELSQRRAEAVKAYLGQQGVNTGAITVVAKGKSEPLALSNDNHYTQEQIYELDRRVEVSFQD